MTFLSLSYALFLISILGIYWSVQQEWLRLWTLLFASLVFYGSLQIEYIPLLVVAVLINFWLGLELGENVASGPHAGNWQITNEDWQFAQQDWNRRRTVVLWIGIALNVLLLLGFKYIPFLLEIVGLGFQSPAIQSSADWIKSNVIAPLGISFFCFECIAYLIDVYRGAPATRNLLQFAAYKLFFVKLISGPITRFHPFVAQLKSQRFPDLAQISEGVWLIGMGAVKKGLLADRLGIYVDLCFNNLQRAGSSDLWLATFAYGLQLYLDFSGYVDIVRGSALLLGFNLPQNFEFPYFTTSIADFWRRWHMTLGDWLRNYLYFPLGGSRRGLLRTCLNLMLIMLIAGIWHGAAWGFIIWGALHGLALVAHRLTDNASKQFGWLQTFWQFPPGVLLAWLLTQSFVFGAWVFFRLPEWKDFSWVVSHLWGHTADVQFAQKVYVESIGLNAPQITLCLILLALISALIYFIHRGLKLQLNWPLKLMLVPFFLYIVWLLAPTGGTPYIYFDF
ncbi:MAG: MBOAT family protein [Leptolyngbyaceae cyanobacterium bins.59]|nr:MBOAT family protein [Leptolyngbyaceae cyanobacterium bins.59]